MSNEKVVSPARGGAGWRIVARVLAAATLLAAGISSTGASAARVEVPACTGRWELQASPNPGSVSNELYGVATVSSTDAWAVGQRREDDGNAHVMIEHWDGQRWQSVRAPKISDPDFVFTTGIAAVAADDVWAVGTFGFHQTAFTVHWDGSRWSNIEIQPLGFFAALYAVTAVSADDVWAVGTFAEPVKGRVWPLVEHWDGLAWSWVDVPPDGWQGRDSYQLLAVSWISKRDIWAVGTTERRQRGKRSSTFTLHWDGRAWTTVPSPNLRPWGHNELRSVAGFTGDDVFAVGWVSNANYQNGTNLVLHWDGQDWVRVRSDQPGQNSSYLRGISLSPVAAWAVGGYDHNSLVERWDGSAWVKVHSPSPGTSNVLSGVASLSTGESWAVGTKTSNGVRSTLIEHFCQPFRRG